MHYVEKGGAFCVAPNGDLEAETQRILQRREQLKLDPPAAEEQVQCVSTVLHFQTTYESAVC